MKKLSINI